MIFCHDPYLVTKHRHICVRCETAELGPDRGLCDACAFAIYDSYGPEMVKERQALALERCIARRADARDEALGRRDRELKVETLAPHRSLALKPFDDTFEMTVTAARGVLDSREYVGVYLDRGQALELARRILLWSAGGAGGRE